MTEFLVHFEPVPYERPCSPPFWARGGHLQTILAHVLPTPAPALDPLATDVRTCDIELPGGDQLRAFYRAGTSGTLISVFHGLSGNSDSDYMRLTIQVAQRAGHSILAVNHRGCGAGRGMAQGLYHSGRADDVAGVLGWARRELAETQHIAVGFSLSGNAILLALAESAAGGLPGPDGAIAVNPPIDLRACSVSISSGFNTIYDKRFVRRCLSLVRERMEDGLLPSEYVLPNPKTLWEFDEVVTAPLGGFEDAEDYYRRCSTRKRLESIDKPTVVIHSLDDPFVSSTAYDSIELSRQLHLHLEEHGGHVGYLTGGALSPEKWLGGALSHYVEEVCAAVLP